MRLIGSFTPPGDKSISHRLVLFSLLAKGQTRIHNLSPCDDVASSLSAAQALGLQAQKDGETLVVTGLEGRLAPEGNLDCGNSGTSIRLLMGLLAGRPGRYTLFGDESLSRRPMERVATPLRTMGAAIETREGRPPVLVAGGALTGIDYDLPVASAQLKSALLLAGIQARGTTSLSEPASSRDHTERLIRAWGGTIDTSGGRIRVQPSQLTLPEESTAPGDASSAAFFLIAALLIPGSRVTAEKMLLNPTRIGFLDVLKRMGGRIEVEVQNEGRGTDPEPWGRVTAEYSPGLRAVRVTGKELPLLVDEVPILALAGALAAGDTVFEDAGELRIKETDRLAAVQSELGKMGVPVRIEGDRLIVPGVDKLKPPTQPLDSHGDHRLAMTARLALAAAGIDAPILREEAASVSYPGFHRDLESLLK